MKWFRLHHSLFETTKFKRLSIVDRYRYLHLYYLVSKNSERGCLSELDDADIAFELDMKAEDWLALKAKLISWRLIAETDHLFFPEWLTDQSSRDPFEQPESDDSFVIGGEV